MAKVFGRTKPVDDTRELPIQKCILPSVESKAELALDKVWLEMQLIGPAITMALKKALCVYDVMEIGDWEVR